MSSKSNSSIARIVLQIAIGLFLLVGGIWGVDGKGGDFACLAIKKLNFPGILVTIFAVIEIVCGALLILKVFVGDKFGKFDNLLGWIILIIWIVAILLGDFLTKGAFEPGKLEWWYDLACHVIIGGAMWYLSY